MSKQRSVPINGKTYNFREEKISLDNLVHDNCNPRYGRYPSMSFDEMKAVLKDTDKDLDTLMESIRSNGGLIEPIIVKPEIDGKGRQTGRFIVKEGFRRFVSLTMLRAMEPGKWEDVICIVAPDNLDDGGLQIQLGILHLQQKKPWESFECAKHAHGIRKYFKSFEEMSSLIGVSADNLRRMCNTYELCEKYMKETGDSNPHYSQIFQVMKNGAGVTMLLKNTKEARSNRKMLFRALQVGAFKTGNDQPSHNSSRFLKIIKNDLARQVFEENLDHDAKVNDDSQKRAFNRSYAIVEHAKGFGESMVYKTMLKLVDLLDAKDVRDKVVDALTKENDYRDVANDVISALAEHLVEFQKIGQKRQKRRRKSA